MVTTVVLLTPCCLQNRVIESYVPYDFNSESTLYQRFVRFVHIAERPSSTGPNVLTMQIDIAST